MHPILEFLQESVRSSSVQSPTPFSILELGKALFTLPLLTVVSLVATARAVWRLRGGRPHDPLEVRSAIDLCFFWGAFTFCAGVFHTLMSLVSTLWSVQLYAPIEPNEQSLIARAVMIAFIAGAYGLLVFLLMALAWLGLLRWHERVAPATA